VVQADDTQFRHLGWLVRQPEFTVARDRDAYPTIRGFVYQVTLTLRRWINLEEGQHLELERGEDIDLVCRAVNAATSDEADRLLEQVKHREQNLTLRTPAALEFLANAVEHTAANPTTHLRFCFTTNANVGVEQSCPFPDRIGGITLWEQVRRGELAEPDRLRAISALAEFLAQSIRPDSIAEQSWIRLQEIVAEADRSHFAEFVSRFEWSTSTTDADSVDQDVRNRLIEQRVAVDEAQAEQLFQRLFLFVFKRLCESGIKRLTRIEFQQQVTLPTLSESDHATLARLNECFCQLESRVANVEATVATFDKSVKELTAKQGIHALLLQGVLSASMSPSSLSAGSQPGITITDASRTLLTQVDSVLANLRKADGCIPPSVLQHVDVSPLLQPLLTAILGGPSATSVPLVDKLDFAPPVLPDPLASRLSSFAALSHLLDSLSCVAIVGYPKSGKTTATSEYANAHPFRCIWLNASESVEFQGSWREITQHRISRHLNLSGSSESGFQHGLLEHSMQRGLLLVVDDAHLLSDLNEVGPFISAAAASNGRVRVILVGIDEVEFLARLRSSLIREWRLPGLSEEQATVLCEQNGLTLTALQRSALSLLVSKTDGHPGMLKLAMARILQIRDRSDFAKLLSDFTEGIGSGLNAFQSHLAERFRAALSPPEHELCRRLAVSVRAFPKRLGNALWSLDRPENEFSVTWNGCVLRVFDEHPGARHALPVLYRNVLMDSSSPVEQQSWHGAAAVELARPQSGSLDPNDVADAVYHRLVSGNVAEALDDASRFLVFASGRHARSIRRFLIVRFQLFLSGAVRRNDVSHTAVIRWLAVSLPILREVRQQDRMLETAARLREVLEASSLDAEESAVQLGWAALLVHGSVQGDVTLCKMAGSHLASVKCPDVDQRFDWVSFAVLSGFLTARSDPTAFLLELLAGRQPNALSLWPPESGLDFWRAVGATIYVAVEKGASPKDRLNDLERIENELHRIGEDRAALVIGSVISRIQIDILRDFGGARATAERLVSGTESPDRDLKAILLQTYGNALRCSGEVEAAASQYREALAVWPLEMVNERAESQIMRGICLARQGQLLTAVESLEEAVRLYDQDGTSWGRQMSAQSRLEAAAVATLAGMFGRAVRHLIRAHAILKPGDPTSPEWVVVGQLAWHLSDRIRGISTGPAAPVPGFTIGLRGQIPGSEQMEPMAPTLMLGNACVAFDLPHRGLELLLEVWQGVTVPERRFGAARFGVDAAIAIGRLDMAVTLGLAATDWFWTHGPPEQLDAYHAFLLDHDVGRIIQLAIDVADTSDARGELQSATSAAEAAVASSCPAHEITLNALTGMLVALEEDDTSKLHNAFQVAIAHRALAVARHVCFFFLFKYARGRQVQESEFLTWEWRLAWLTCETGSHDSDFLGRWLGQQHQLFSQISTVRDASWARECLTVLNQSGESPEKKVLELRDQLTLNAFEMCGVRLAVGEAALILRTVKAVDSDEVLKNEVLGGLGTLLLSPLASSHVSQLRSDVSALHTAIQNVRERKEDWTSTISALDVLTRVLETGDFVDGVCQSLLQLVPALPRFTPASEANYYVWLRHSLQGISDGTGRELMVQVSRLLTSERVGPLLESADVPDYLRVRLAAAHFGARGFAAAIRVLEAVVLLKTQYEVRGPIRLASVIDAERSRDDAIAELINCLSKLERAERDCRQLKMQTYDLASFCLDRGIIRKFGAAGLLKSNDHEKLLREWIQSSIEDFRRSLEAAKQLPLNLQAEARIKAANEGISSSAAIGDATAKAEFEAEIESLRTDSANWPAIERAELSRRHDPLAEEFGTGREREVLDTGGEDAIQDLTDLVMKAAGYPADRRRHVESDARKIVRIKVVQWEYCRHLQPLQNLLHMNSPETVFARPTVYTCSCELLGHETQIEMEDIDVVIDAMKRTFCEGCPERSPLCNET
jgi:hypothetical protein